ncbi:MAG TPA: glycosyltransferase [Treponemataceae bacterium]|nr:glycosyltransferase [Treponemataceae bacterium]
MSQNIVFLYLNTGGGHKAPAKALAAAFERLHPNESSVHLLNGFSERMRMCRFFFEDGYQLTSNFFEPAYVLFYRLTEHPCMIRFGNYFVQVHGVTHLARFIRRNRITKVVCLHEALILNARRAIDSVDPSIPLITILTDPFTAHGIWFYQKNMELVVFSEKLRKEAVAKYGFDPARVHAFPFILNEVYERRYTEGEIRSARARLGIPDGRKVLLVAGGGEGLKGSDRLVANFVRRGSDEILIVVCGRNEILKRLIERIVERSGAANVMVLGFVSFMPDLLNIADCVITKGGASTVMEVLAVGKPVIFSTFIRGQELGNVLYAVHGGAGWLVKKPSMILDKAFELINDPVARADVARNIDRMGIRNGLGDVADFIWRFGSDQ